MATKHHNYVGRRACTEMPESDPRCEAFDLNNLPDDDDDHQTAAGAAVDDDVDDINFENYKGIYANDDNGQKYQCPETGAHFEVNDLCRRLNKIQEKRKAQDEQIYGKQAQKAQPVQVQAAPVNEIFSSSIMSEKLEHPQPPNIQPGNPKNIQFKNKFEEPVSQTRQQVTNHILQRPQEKSLNGNSRNNKENCHTFLQQKSMKDLILHSNNQLLSAHQISQHNKRQSQDRTRTQQKSQLNTMDTYSKLMQIMNEKLMKNAQNTGVSRGKSIEQSSKLVAQPSIMQQSNSSKKLKVVSAHSNATQATMAYNCTGSQSRDKSLNNHSISTALKNQAKILSSGSSRNTQSGINGQHNTQNATKQFLSFYSNKQNHGQIQTTTTQLQRENSQHKLSSQKSTGALNQKVINHKSHVQQDVDNSTSINEIMSKYLKQGQHPQFTGNNVIINQNSMATDKSRNMISSSKTHCDSNSKNTYGSQSKQGTRPMTSNNNGSSQQAFVVPSSQSKMVNQQNKRKSGSGLEFAQSRNNPTVLQHQTTSNIMYTDATNDYLRRVENQNSIGITSTVLHDIQRKIESKGKIKSSGSNQSGYSMSKGHISTIQGHQPRGSSNLSNYFSSGGAHKQ